MVFVHNCQVNNQNSIGLLILTEFIGMSHFNFDVHGKKPKRNARIAIAPFYHLFINSMKLLVNSLNVINITIIFREFRLF